MLRSAAAAAVSVALWAVCGSVPISLQADAHTYKAYISGTSTRHAPTSNERTQTPTRREHPRTGAPFKEKGYPTAARMRAFAFAGQTGAPAGKFDVYVPASCRWDLCPALGQVAPNAATSSLSRGPPSSASSNVRWAPPLTVRLRLEYSKRSRCFGLNDSAYQS